MRPHPCVTWFKVCLIVLGLAMLAVLVIMSDVANVWWQARNSSELRLRNEVNSSSILGFCISGGQ